MHERATAARAPAVVPGGLPELSLRERKKAETMRRVQTVAVELFTERGFDHVTIEEIAAAAAVSPSTVYRYFGTKERLVLHDEYDDMLLGMLPSLLEQLGPFAATEHAMAVFMPAHLSDPRMRGRVRLWFDHPSVRAAGYLLIDEMSDEMARLVTDASRGDYTLSQARAVVGGLVGAVITALRDWHENGGEDDLTAMITGGLQALRRALGPQQPGD